MRVLRAGDAGWFAEKQREQARWDAAVLVPRPGCPIFGLASPALRPVRVAGYQVQNGDWMSIGLRYGEINAGPGVTVTTAAVAAVAATVAAAEQDQAADKISAGNNSMDGVSADKISADKISADLREAIDLAECNPGVAIRTARPGEVSRERLPAGDALVMRDGGCWAARLLTPPGTVIVTIAGRDVDPAQVFLEELADLRPVIEARLAEFLARLERLR
ncbi:MAG TPA: hypothetical protein VGM12_32940 [Trebonia sp.]